MLKKRILLALTSLAIVASIIGSNGAAQVLGLLETPEAHACHVPGHGGGGGGGC